MPTPGTPFTSGSGLANSNSRLEIVLLIAVPMQLCVIMSSSLNCHIFTRPRNEIPHDIIVTLSPPCSAGIIKRLAFGRQLDTTNSPLPAFRHSSCPTLPRNFQLWYFVRHVCQNEQTVLPFFPLGANIMRLGLVIFATESNNDGGKEVSEWGQTDLIWQNVSGYEMFKGPFS